MNDFLYYVIRPDAKRGNNVFVYCSGVNVSRFFSITAGKYRFGQNPAVKGLQSSNLEVRSFLLSRGAVLRSIRGDDCSGIITGNDLWNSELFLIEDVPQSFPPELVRFAVLNLLEIVLPGCLPNVKLPPLPQEFPTPEQLQAYLQSLTQKG
ncbi:hypothetical protein MBAV_001413 [Candidatus Magnetobacterium bavaricum]|uniref:Uncharacterized protein n=1 Tax=Candidatus Magnetobacterium bavaricum TaxID=29290 RepID=A0A0F3GWZ0_9BACT|nr:hypothetical protein MBAV_001413 [Candidatus Magnetobacterium bavaricum]